MVFWGTMNMLSQWNISAWSVDIMMVSIRLVFTTEQAYNKGDQKDTSRIECKSFVMFSSMTSCLVAFYEAKTIVILVRMKLIIPEMVHLWYTQCTKVFFDDRVFGNGCLSYISKLQTSSHIAGDVHGLWLLSAYIPLRFEHLMFYIHNF